MAMKKTDRRIKYTKRVIKESFVKLLKQKPIAKITIKELCDDADINRSTFYAHYLDQYDLLQQIENEIVAEVNEYLSSYNFKLETDVPVDLIEKIISYIRDNAELFDLLLNSKGNMNFQEEITKIIGHQHFLSLDRNPSISDTDAEYMFHFLASGSLGIIRKWLKDGMKKTPQEIAELILQLSINGRSSFD